ncbi:MAG: hypothetical protein QOD28_1087 [Acidobacteriota bacterium]|nr:hypothetical protein [Acidobacteriota bacterium]
MRHTAPAARRLLSIFLVALIIFPNLFIAPTTARAASSQQNQIRVYGYVKNQYGAPVSGALVTIGGQAAGGIATDANGYFYFSLFNGSCGPFEFKAFINNVQVGGSHFLNDCYFSDTAVPDFIYNQPPVNGKIAFISMRTGGQEIWTMEADGTNQQRVTLIYGATDPAYSPDGSKIAFTYHNEIFVMNADGSNQTLVAAVDDSYIDTIAWSADGARLAYSTQRNDGSRSGIHTVNADGTNPLQLTDTSGIDALPAWSPDGARLVFTRAFLNVQTGSFTQSIYVVKSDGTNLFKFDNNAGELDYFPAWSPGGAEIAFLRFPADGAGLANLYAVRPDGTGRRNLTTGNTTLYGAPRWSPDGGRLSFVAEHSEGAGLYVVKADGTGRTTVFAGSNSVDNVSWSPDGTKLSFLNPYGEVYLAFHTVNADGTGLQHIGGDFEYNSNPDWSPDSQRLAFATQRNGSGIDLVNADGTQRVALTDGQFSDQLPKWQPSARPNTPAGANVAVAANGVTLNFANVTNAGNTSIRPIDPNALQGIPGEYVINANTLAYEITTTATYTGAITIGFQVAGITNPFTFSALRVLHGEPPPVPNFVDRTILAPDAPAHNFATRTVYARVTSLSPFVITERVSGGDQTAPDINIAAPVADAVYLLRQNVGASYACADAGSGVASCVGTVANGASLNTAAVGSYTFAVNARDHAGNESARTVNYRVAYGVNALYDQTKAHKSGSTIPVKLELTDAARVNQSASNIVITALSVTRISDNAPGALAAPGDANPDYNFRYAGGSYQFNLKTGGYATGTYLLSFKAGNDPTTHTVQFQVK